MLVCSVARPGLVVMTTQILKDDYDLHAVVPAWLPFNEVARTLVDDLLAVLNYPKTGPKAEKYRVAVASFLKASQSVLACQERKKPQHLGVRRRDEAWSLYPLTGRVIWRTVATDFVSYYEATEVEGSGDRGWYEDEKGKWRIDPKMSMYRLDATQFPKQLQDARFIEVGRPPVKVNKAETRQQSKKRKKDKKPKPFLKQKQAKLLDEGRLRASESRIQRLNDYWRQHPLILPNGNAAACAARIFHDGSYEAGGRLYGAWTMLDNEDDQRLLCTIDGEPVCELDIRASQPTLLSCLVGVRLNPDTDFDSWSDPYTELANLKFLENRVWGDLLEEFTSTGASEIDPPKLTRDVAKAVVMEMIGYGDANKAKPSKNLVKDTGVTQGEWDLCRVKLTEVIPALKKLEPRYDKKGNLDGILNGPVFLSHHESEMTLEAVEELHDRGIPAYPVHDCLMVRVSDAKVAADVYRETIRQYCKDMSGLNVLVPLDCEVAEGVTIDTLPREDDLRGEYL